MITKYVITHREYGIFMGHCLGMAFWSKLDPAGQPYVPVFNTVSEAESMISSWINGHDRLRDYSFNPVKLIGSYEHVGLKPLIDAGLNEHVGKLWFLYPIMGTA